MIVEILKNLGFVGGNFYPCLYVKKSAKGITFIAFSIDDNQIVGDIKTIDGTITALKENRLVLNIMEGLQNYLSWEIKFSTDKKGAWLGQSHLIKNLAEKFGIPVKK